MGDVPAEVLSLQQAVNAAANTLSAMQGRKNEIGRKAIFFRNVES
jgi:hypothetical protein